jgi:anti-sigma factor RsiW
MADVDQEFDELLSAYVDGELSADEEQRVRQRLEAEPGLVAAVEALRADRRARTALWQSCEPDEASVQRLIDRVDHAIGRQTVWAYRLSKIRTVSAAAACIVLGVLIGRITLGPRAGQPVSPIAGTQGPVVNGTNVGLPAVPQAPASVRIMDGNGKQVMIQHFRSMEEAQHFIHDLQQWQQEQEQIQSGGGGGIVPASSERF